MKAINRFRAVAFFAGVMVLVTIGVSNALPQPDAVQAVSCVTGHRLAAHDNGRLPARKGL